MNSEKLKPCPFCGGEADIFGHTASWGAMCTKCGSCNRQGSKTEAEAIKKWNNRADSNYSVFPNSSKLTYADVEKMVKPLEWVGVGDYERAYVNPHIYFAACGAWGAYSLVRIDKYGNTNAINLAEDVEKSLEAQKQNARKFLVSLVAAALGVERSK